MAHILIMDKNKQTFFELIKAGLWEKDVELRKYGTTDFEEIMLLAEEQSVVGLVTAGLEHVSDTRVPQEILLQFIGQSLQIEQQNKEMNKFIAKLVSKMRDAGISTLLVKGQGVAQTYEKPLWRANGDVDLFFSDDNYRKAKGVLIPIASSVETEYVSEQHLGMVIDDYVVELHGTLHCGLSKSVERGLDEVKRAAINDGKVRSWNNENTIIFLLNADEDVIYVFTHIMQHFYKGGIGLKQMCDWCRLIWTFHDSLDLRLLERRIGKMGLMTEWKAFGAFAVEFLGMPVDAMPMYSDDDKWKQKASQIKDFILMSGNFGQNRDMSYYDKYSYLIRKICSMWMRVSDLINHAMIFPLDSLKFFPRILFNGLRSAVRGE